MLNKEAGTQHDVTMPSRWDEASDWTSELCECDLPPVRLVLLINVHSFVNIDLQFLGRIARLLIILDIRHVTFKKNYICSYLIWLIMICINKVDVCSV